jgi:quercetin dioxygenase-like cupin family protein
MSTRALFHRDGEGDRLSVLGTEVTVKVTANDTGGAYEVVIVESGHGGDAVPHRHPWQEFYFLLDGEVDVQIGARRHRLQPGGMVTIPPRALHAFNVVSGSARFLHVSAGHGATAMFHDFAVNVPHAPTIEDLHTVLDVGARHGIELGLAAEVIADALAAAT